MVGSPGDGKGKENIKEAVHRSPGKQTKKEEEPGCDVYMILSRVSGYYWECEGRQGWLTKKRNGGVSKKTEGL